MEGVANLNMTFGTQGRTYRRLASQEEDALFSFGWGLSFTQFSYSKLVTSEDGCSETGLCIVSVTVTNTGKVAGAEVAELYLGLDPSGSALPAVEYALAGFEKVMLAPGESQIVTFAIDAAKSLTVVGADGRRKAAVGSVAVSVGGHLPSDPRAKLAANAKHVSNIATGTFTM